MSGFYLRIEMYELLLKDIDVWLLQKDRIVWLLLWDRDICVTSRG